MNAVVDYYNNKKLTPFAMWGLRRDQTMPIVKNIHGLKVLDIGCASGYVGASLRKQGNYVVGIDITKKDITKAKKVLDEAYIFNIESDNLARLGKNYDMIVMVEVIEHLFDPEKAIKRFLPLLKPHGRLLISTPNFVQLYNRLKVTLGIFEYKEDTVINKSHIHFFTRTTFLRMLKSLKLKIIKENNVILPETFSSIFKYWPNLFSHQIIILAEKNCYENQE